MTSDAGRGWDSDLETFRNTEARAIIERLSAFVRDASEAQVRAWKDAVPPLQREASEHQQGLVAKAEMKLADLPTHTKVEGGAGAQAEIERKRAIIEAALAKARARQGGR